MERTSILTNDYFSDLIKQITAQANKIISATQISEQETISNLKNLLISSVDEIQIPDMNKNFSKTALFIPNKKFDAKKNDINFKNKIGKLVILRDQIDFFVLSNLSKIFKDNLSADDLDFKTFKEALETTILQKLIELKSIINDPIIDLTNIGKNHLEKLTIDGKKSKFDENDFNEIVKLINCKKLDEFNLFYKNENFQRIHVDTFANFQNLKKLVIKCDHLNLIKSKNFSILSNLEYLSITESKINKIEKGAFHGLIQLKWLFLSSNEITNIEAENFIGLDHLEYLILNQNKIESIENKTFAALVNLKALEMVENRIKFLSENSFDGLFSLKILNLNHNKSGLRIDNKAFNSLSSLEVLDLASNTIEHLDSLVFDKLKNLRYLNLSNNLFHSLDFINRLEKLEALNFMRMKQIAEEINSIHLNNLKFLKIEIENVPVFNTSLKQLRALDLNGVTSFQVDCLKYLGNLEFLKIITKKDSIIEKIDENLLKPIKKIRHFFLEVEKFGNKSLEKFRQCEIMLLELFSRPNSYASETEIDEMKKKLYLQITDCESEWIYFQNMLDVSDQVRNAILTSEMSISHYESIASL